MHIKRLWWAHVGPNSGDVGSTRTLSQDGSSRVLVDFGLAGQKGSDVSAREATLKLVAASSQLKALQRVLTALGADVGLEPPGAHSETAEDGATWIPRNTIVRDVFQELGNVATPASHARAALVRRSGPGFGPGTAKQ
jgi:hypothetical protein